MYGDRFPHLSNVGSIWERGVSFNFQPIPWINYFFPCSIRGWGQQWNVNDTRYRHAFFFIPQTSLLLTSPWANLMYLCTHYTRTPMFLAQKSLQATYVLHTCGAIFIPYFILQKYGDSFTTAINVLSLSCWQKIKKKKSGLHLDSTGQILGYFN